MSSNFSDRAYAALLGHALGDSYGAPLEFLRGEAVRKALVDVSAGSFRWTDDTHMGLYLGRALMDHGPGPFDEDRFGRAVGRRFVQWLHDPYMPLTAPGGTCLRGAKAFQQGGDWRRSGDHTSDGCGAVMRVPPLPFVLTGESLHNAARVQALVTHAHPNAVEASVAASFILRWVLESGRLERDHVREAIRGLHGEWAEGGDVARSLEDALTLSGQSDPWLNDRAVAHGDGGWRSGSALGLALAAALRWGSDFPTAIDRAARIDGDSDSVACLVGLFLGATLGTEGLPASWLQALFRREELDALFTGIQAQFGF